MRLLVVHQNFPGQFGFMVGDWAKHPGWDVRGLGSATAPGLPGFDALVRYALHRKVRAGQHPYLRQMEAATLYGQAAARAMLALRKSGFVPDVILAHPGWGETLYAKDVFPDARLVHLCEWFYNAEGADLGFDPEFPIDFDDRARIRTWNALHALNLSQCDLGIAPTHWQKSRHPQVFHPKMVVQHEGIAVDELRPDSTASVTTPSGILLRAGDPVITYVARNLEPYRGFHVFMRALERIQKVLPTCHAVVVGGDEISYGKPPKGSMTWREHLLKSVTLDLGRTHFLGRVPRHEYIRILQISAAHVYLTYPFVLSWSMLEAMACGAPLIVSDTAPVREVIDNASIARRVDFFDVEGLAAAAVASLKSPLDSRAAGVEVRGRARRFDRAVALRRYAHLLGLERPSAAGQR